MNKFKSFLIITSLSLLIACSSSINVVHLNNSNIEIKNNGFIYFLPQTTFDIEFTVTRNEFTAGPYAEYAEKYLSIENVELESSCSYQITNIMINTISQPDPEAAFLIYSGSKSTNFNISLNENGILRGINLPNEDETLTENQNTANYVNFTFPNKHSLKFTDYTVKRNFINKSDTTYRVIKTDSVYQKIPIINNFITSKDIEQKAEEAANFIIKIRKRRFQVLTGQTEHDAEGEAIATMVEKLDELEQKYLSLFIGVNETTTETYRSIYTPQKENQNTILFWFTQDSGVSFEKVEKADKVCIEVKNLGTTEQISKFYKKQANLEPKKTGFYYRIPGKAEVKITLNEKTLYNNYFDVAQMGFLNWMDINSLSKKNFQIIMNPNLGSLQYIY